MKNNIFKFISLSMLPLSLMSFKGNSQVSDLGSSGINKSLPTPAVKIPDGHVPDELFAYSRRAEGLEGFSADATGPEAWDISLTFFAGGLPSQPSTRLSPNSTHIVRIPQFWIEESNRLTRDAELNFEFTSPEYGTQKINLLKYYTSNDLKGDTGGSFDYYLNRRYIVGDGKDLDFQYYDNYALFDLNKLLISNLDGVDLTRLFSNNFEHRIVLHLYSVSNSMNVKFGGEFANDSYVQFSPVFPVYSGNLKDGETKDVYVNLDSPSSLDQIKAGIKASDLFGADVAVQYSVKEGSKEYDPNNIGIYSYILKATDSYGQTATATLNINVVDNASPIISEDSTLGVGYSKKLTYEMLKEHFKIADNSMGKGGSLEEPKFYVGGVEITSSSPYSLNVDMAKAKSLTVKATVSDSSTNRTEKEFAVNVLDDVAPVMTFREMEDSTEKPKVVLGLSAALTYLSGNMAQLFQATDEVDGEIHFSKFKLSEELRLNKLGKYDFTIAVSDKAGNTTEMPLEVEVIKDTPPVFILSGQLVLADKEHPMSSDEVENLVVNGLFRGKYVNRDSQDFFVSSAEYVSKAKEVGEYSVSYSVPYQEKDENGRVMGEQKIAQGDVTIKVVDSLKGESSDTFWDSVVDWHANNTWAYWVYGTLGLALLAMLAVAILRRR